MWDGKKVYGAFAGPIQAWMGAGSRGHMLAHMQRVCVMISACSGQVPPAWGQAWERIAWCVCVHACHRPACPLWWEESRAAKAPRR